MVDKLSNPNQLSIWDMIEPIEPIKIDVPCGYIDDLSFVGKELQFTDLKDFIGKKVVLGRPTHANMCYKVIRICDYYENEDTYYRRVRELPPSQVQYGEIVNSYIHDVVGIKECMECYEPYFVCDRIGYADKDRCKKAECWVSEAYCANGRFSYTGYQGLYPDTFYELNI